MVWWFSFARMFCFPVGLGRGFDGFGFTTCTLDCLIVVGSDLVLFCGFIALLFNGCLTITCLWFTIRLRLGYFWWNQALRLFSIAFI